MKFVARIRKSLQSVLLFLQGKAQTQHAPNLPYEEESALSAQTCRAKTNEPSPQDYGRQTLYKFPSQSLDKTTRLPPIYSGIGLGVYQGEVVTFRLMAVGEKRWVVSTLRFEDLSLFPPSLLSEVWSVFGLLCLNSIQSDLVKKGLQTKGGIELMRSYCPQAGNPDKLLTELCACHSLSLEGMQANQQIQSQLHRVCSISGIECPFVTKSNIKNETESNLEGGING